MKRPGHCALAMGVAPAKPKCYISYWPDSASPVGNFKERKAVFSTLEADLVQELGPRARTALQGGAQPRPRQTQSPLIEIGNCDGLVNRNMEWVKLPDEVIELPVSTADNPIGPSEEAITDWWRLFSSDLGYKTYIHLFQKNKLCEYCQGGIDGWGIAFVCETRPVVHVSCAK